MNMNVMLMKTDHEAKAKERKLWHIDMTIPPTDECKWCKNERVNIAATSMELALAKAREKYPTATFWRIGHSGKLHLEAD